MAIAGIVTSALGLLSTLLIIPLMIAILLPALSPARASAQRLQSSSNIRMMLQGLSIQSQSNGGLYPQTADDWQQNLIDDGLAGPEIFVSPSTDSLGDDYFFVPGGRDDFDATRIVVYEDPALNPDGTLIGFADAHVEWLDQAPAMQMLSTLTLPAGTRYAPSQFEFFSFRNGVYPASGQELKWGPLSVE